MKILCLLFLFVGVALAEYCHRPNLDCFGNDIRSFAGDTDACKAACTADSNCKSIQSYEGRCWLKRKACTNGDLRVFMAANDYVKHDGKCGGSQYTRKNNKYCKRVDTDCFGHDIVHIPKTAGVDVCQDLCDFNTDCKSIQILDNGDCWIKKYVCKNSELRPFNGGNDYVKAVDGNCADYKNPRQKYCLRENLDCLGHSIHHLNWVQTRKECQELCDFNSACKSIQYKTPDCWLKKHACSNDELRPLPSYSDLVKIAVDGSCQQYKAHDQYRYCERADKDCFGNDIFSTRTDSAEVCQHFCSYKSECKSIQYWNGTCWLKRKLCKDSELRDFDKAKDYVRIARKDNCKDELAKLA